MILLIDRVRVLGQVRSQQQLRGGDNPPTDDGPAFVLAEKVRERSTGSGAVVTTVSNFQGIKIVPTTRTAETRPLGGVNEMVEDVGPGGERIDSIDRIPKVSLDVTGDPPAVGVGSPGGAIL